MRNLFYSLQFRLVIGFVAVLALALTSVSFYVGTVAARETDRFEEDLAGVRAQRITEMVNRYGGSLDSEEVRQRIQQAAELYGWEIVLTAPGRLLADLTQTVDDHPRDLRLRPRDAGPQDAVLAIDQAGRFTFTRQRHRPDVSDANLVSAGGTPGGQVALRDPPPDRIVDSVNRTLMWSGGLAAAVGSLLIVLMSRGLLRPVRELSAAAAGLGRGDLTQRVPGPGKDEIGRLSNTFNAMASDLERAETARRHMVADVSHELRTPLSNIQGYVEAMREGVLKPDDEVLGRLQGLVAQLTRLVEDLRVLALAEAGALPIEPRPMGLLGIVMAAVDSFQPRAAAEGVSLVPEVDEDVTVMADADRITQVLGNLLENAVIHTPRGGEVRVLAGATSGKMASVSVIDTGRGMGEEDLARVFDRFYRADRSRARETGGSGLGLTISRHIVEAHGGTIRAESAPGEGATFTFELPLA